jgi:hypothetical protein
MLRWLANVFAHHAPTPEKQADRAMKDLRMDLFQAEQQVIDAQLRADYYRARLTFLEEVTRMGIEQVSDQRKCHEEKPQALRSALKLTAAQ